MIFFLRNFHTRRKLSRQAKIERGHLSPPPPRHSHCIILHWMADLAWELFRKPWYARACPAWPWPMQPIAIMPCPRRRSNGPLCIRQVRAIVIYPTIRQRGLVA